jgi:hypothetical protein
LLGRQHFLMKERALRHGVGHIRAAQAGQVHPVGAHDQRRAGASLKQRREAHGLAGTHQDTVHTAANHGFRDRPQLHDVRRHVAHIAVDRRRRTPRGVAVPVEQACHAASAVVHNVIIPIVTG